MTSTPRAAPAARRWSITKSAAVLHREVLGSAGFERRGTIAFREDFLRREVLFSAARWRQPDERALEVTFHLSWRELTPPPSGAHIWIGGGLRREFLQPWEGEGASLDPDLVAGVSGPVLDYLTLPTTPVGFIDWLLAYEPTEEGELTISYGPAVHYMSAAWGSLLLGDGERCAVGLERAREAADAVSQYVREVFEAESRVLDRTWLERHGAPRLRSA